MKWHWVYFTANHVSKGQECTSALREYLKTGQGGVSHTQRAEHTLFVR